MGTLCSCARSDQAHVFLHGRSSSFADVYLTGRKFDIRVSENGQVSTIARPPNNHAYPVPLEYLIDDTCATGNNNEHFAICHSRNTLDESGIESSGPSDMSVIESSRSATLSAPATPYAIRQKPPPKPPRMRQFSYDGSGGSNTLPTRNTLLSRSQASAPAFPESPGPTSSLDFSFKDASSAFDISFSSTADIQPVSRIYPTNTADKVYNILLQTKDFLVHEIDIDIIVPSLQEKRVLDTRAVNELGRMKDKTAACERLLDMLMSKSHPEFVLFCDTLKHRARCPHLADLLLALDSLVDLGSEDSVKKRASVSDETMGLDPENVVDTCPMCEKQRIQEPDDFLTDTTNFDVEILYINKQTGQTKSLKDVAEMKKRKLASAGGGRNSAKNSAVTAELVKHEADNYSPVISASLYNYCLWNQGMDKITKAIGGKKTCIRELSLSKCHLGTHSVRKLSQALNQTGVYKLDLRLNNITDEGFQELAEGLKRNTTVKVLNLSSTDVSANSCKVLLNGICRNQSTHELDIGFNDLQDTGCSVIAEALTTNCPLKKLRIRDNGITPDGAYRLFKALKKNSRLTLLDISSNAIGNASLTTMSEMLRYNRTLKQLNVENCGISRDGCHALARALKSNTVLRSLDMSMNPLKDAGVEALSEGLKYNHVLDVLCLNMCSITNFGFARLLDALQFNMSLKTLKMCYNKIGRNSENGSTTIESSSTPGSSNTSTVDLNQTTATSASDTTLNASHVSMNSGGKTGSTRDLIGGESRKDGKEGPTSAASIDEVYDKLCQVLQQNKDLKVLLWGNKLEEDYVDEHCEASELERAIVHATDAAASDALNLSIASEYDTSGVFHSNPADTSSVFNSSLEVVSESAAEYCSGRSGQYRQGNIENGYGCSNHCGNQQNCPQNNPQNHRNGQHYHQTSQEQKGSCLDCNRNSQSNEQDVSKLNSLQRNFIQQYTIHNGHPSGGGNTGHAKSLSIDLGSQSYAAPPKPSRSELMRQHSYTPTKSSTNNGRYNNGSSNNGYHDKCSPMKLSLDNGYSSHSTPLKSCYPDSGYSSNGTPTTSLPVDINDQLRVGVQSNGGALSRVQVSPRMGTSVPPSVTQPVHPSVATSLNASFNAIFNAESNNPNNNQSHVDYNISTSVPNCNGQVTNMATGNNNVHHSRIRTNGSLPRKPKRMNESNPTVVNGDTAPIVTDNSLEEDVYRPHTIPRRGKKSTVIN